MTGSGQIADRLQGYCRQIARLLQTDCKVIADRLQGYCRQIADWNKKT
jgi:hypothetical protein